MLNNEIGSSRYWKRAWQKFHESVIIEAKKKSPKKSIKRPRSFPHKALFLKKDHPWYSNMSIKFNDSPSSILTPSTIQCTRFYTSASLPRATLPSVKKRYSSMHEMKKYLAKEAGSNAGGGGIIKSQSMPILKATPPLKLLQRSITTSACLDYMLAINVRMSKILI